MSFHENRNEVQATGFESYRRQERGLHPTATSPNEASLSTGDEPFGTVPCSATGQHDEATAFPGNVKVTHDMRSIAQEHAAPSDKKMGRVGSLELGAASAERGRNDEAAALDGRLVISPGLAESLRLLLDTHGTGDQDPSSSELDSAVDIPGPGPMNSTLNGPLSELSPLSALPVSASSSPGTPPQSESSEIAIEPVRQLSELGIDRGTAKIPVGPISTLGTPIEANLGKESHTPSISRTGNVRDSMIQDHLIPSSLSRLIGSLGVATSPSAVSDGSTLPTESVTTQNIGLGREPHVIDSEHVTAIDLRLDRRFLSSGLSGNPAGTTASSGMQAWASQQDRIDSGGIPQDRAMPSRPSDGSLAVDLTKTNELLQQLLDEVRRGRQAFLPLQDRVSRYSE